MADLPFKAFDADHHYYEAEDAFTRHIDPRMKKRCMDWAIVGGKKRLLVGGKINRFIPNPTFDPVAKPGILDDFFRGKNAKGQGIIELFGELDPIHPAYRDRDARLTQLDEQGIEACFMFPTLGVGMEEALRDDPEAICAAFRAFNRWSQEDWGFDYKSRIYAAPYIPLCDVEWACEELEWTIAKGVRIISMTPGPIRGTTHGSPGDPIYDPFWARMAEAGVVLGIHSGDAGYNKFGDEYGVGGDFKAFEFDPLRIALSAAPIADKLAAMICHGVFTRHPELRVATVECGSNWVDPLIKRLEKAYGQMPMFFKKDPAEQFRQNIWVAPYYEDDLPDLKSAIGVEHILFGSDYPHAEGLAVPTDFINDCGGFNDADIQLVMRDNALGLVGGAAAQVASARNA